jgi:hypothetical protein
LLSISSNIAPEQGAQQLWSSTLVAPPGGMPSLACGVQSRSNGALQAGLLRQLSCVHGATATAARSCPAPLPLLQSSS